MDSTHDELTNKERIEHEFTHGEDCTPSIKDLLKVIDEVGENLKENNEDNEDIKDIKEIFESDELYFNHFGKISFCNILDFYKILFQLLNKQYKGKTFGLFGRNKTKLKNRIKLIKRDLQSHKIPVTNIENKNTNGAKEYLKTIIKESNSNSKKGGKTRKSITKTHRKGRKTYRKGRKSNTKTHRKGKKTHRKTRKTN